MTKQTTTKQTAKIAQNTPKGWRKEKEREFEFYMSMKFKKNGDPDLLANPM